MSVTIYKTLSFEVVFLICGFWRGHTKGGCVQLSNGDGRRVVGKCVRNV